MTDQSTTHLSEYAHANVEESVQCSHSRRDRFPSSKKSREITSAEKKSVCEISTFTENSLSRNRLVGRSTDTLLPQSDPGIQRESDPVALQEQSSGSSETERKRLINERGEYVVVGENRTSTRHFSLFSAIEELNKYTHGSRCVFEVKDNHIVENPREVVGFEQTREVGFNCEWDDVADTQRLYKSAALWYADNHKQRPVVQGQFIVVVGNRVVRFCRRLRPAISELRKHGRDAPRCIFEVADHTVIRSVETIAGYRQTAADGFDTHWDSRRDIDLMYGTACVWYARMKLPGQYIAVANGKARFFDRLHKAQDVLSRMRVGEQCIFEVRDGKVVEDPTKIAGIEQIGTNGFNARWSDDVQKLRRIALLEYARRYMRVDNVAGRFLVVLNSGVRSFRRLRPAMRALRGTDESSRCIFSVEGGEVQCSPLVIQKYRQCPAMGFDSYWISALDVMAMFVRAREWLLADNASEVKNKAGSFVVIVKEVVLGRYNNLRAAQRALTSAAVFHEQHPRVIFEVRNREVLRNASTIAGCPQTWEYGFAARWENETELAQMYDAAVREAHRYVVVFGNTVQGPYYRIREARDKMQGYPADSPEPRAIFAAHFANLTHIREPGEKLGYGDVLNARRIILDYFRLQREKQLKHLYRPGGSE